MEKLILILLGLGVVVFSCTEEPFGQQPIDNVPPGPVSNINIKNTPGGAIFTYSLPKDEDLLYVKAVYSLKKGIQSEVKASLYADTLKIAGFGDTLTHEVSLVAVDRSRNESEPVKMTITPLEPAFISISKTLNMVEGFGGVICNWQNINKAEVRIFLMKKDEKKNEYMTINTFYTSMINGEGSTHGLDAVTSDFGVFVQDRWGNKSEPRYFTLTPLFETKFDRLKFAEMNLPGDILAGWGWVMPRLWDGIVGYQGFHSTEFTGIWPQSFTMDMGSVGKISRIKMWQIDDYYYATGSVRKFEVWGSETLDPSGSWDSWTKLMEGESIKPSGLPAGQMSDEDFDHAAAGEEFMFPIDIPKVRYLRFNITLNWSNTDFFHISELEIYGNNQ